MNWIRQKIDQVKEPFEPGNKLEKYRPAINALDTFYLFQTIQPKRELIFVML